MSPNVRRLTKLDALSNIIGQYYQESLLAREKPIQPPGLRYG
jgi:hypothetical protein